ncbi:unnamed protein product, partial [Adineta steineri]
SILYETLSFGYNITPSSSNIIYCRFSLYMTLVFDILSPFYLLLTLLDYILIRSFMKTTSHREREKRYYFSYIICMSGFVFWMLFHIHALFYSDIVEMKSDYFYCSFQVGFYARLMRYYSLVMKGIVIPLLFVIFGLWIMKNYRNTSRVMCISHLEIVESERKSKDREMIMILVKDIIVYIIFSSITSIIMIYELITEHHIKNVEEKEVEYSIRYVEKMKNLFRSRLPLPLTVAQITRLSIQSRLALEEIEDWYDRFVVCYPYGYVSFKEFQIYLKQLNIYNGHE